MQPLLASDPTHVGDYWLLGRLGRGAMGVVYFARSRGGRLLAVKVVRSEFAEDPEFRERFRREVAMARSVGGFWTAAVVDADPDTEQPWLATEYVPGPTLHRAVADHAPLPEPTVHTLAAGLAEALGAVHRAGLVHRDLKPANVLLGPDGPRVIDFGISRAMEAQAITATGMFLGTPGFFSPEQTVGGEIGPPSDVFSLGAVLVFAATGSGPFGNESTAAMLYRVVHSEADLSQVPEPLRPLLDACLAKGPSARPSTEEILDQLGEPSAQGEHWLPPAITAVINEHATQLQNTANAVGSTPPPESIHPPPQPAQQSPPPQPAAQPRSGARSHNTAQPAPDWSAAQRTDQITPVRPKGTTEQAAPPAAPAPPPKPSGPPIPSVREDNPGPVFSVSGRVRALVWLVVVALVIVGSYRLSDYLINQLDFQWLPDGEWWFVAAINALGVIGVLLLLRALWPPLKMKINGDGIRISRLGLRRELPWQGVTRVGVVGRGKKQAVAIWMTDSAPRPKATWWHRVSRYHGGAKVFPIGASGLWSRRRKIKRVHLGLKQYGGRRYDNRLL